MIKMKYLNKIAIAVMLLFFSSTAFGGGGWPQPKGWGFFKLSEWWVVSNQHFTDAGKIDPNTTMGIFNTSLYAEYGFTDRLTGVLYFPFYSRAYMNNVVSGTTGELLIPGEPLNSIGDTDLSLKYGLTLNKPISVAATLTFGLPLGKDNGSMSGALQTGDGEFNQMLQIDAGSGFRLAKVDAYANAYAGFNNRTNGFSDEFRYGFETGVTFWKKRMTAIARFTGIKSFKNGDLPADRSNSTSIFANNTEFLSFTPEVAYHFNEKWGVSAAVGTAFYGKFIFASPSYSVGVFYKMSK